LDNHATVTVKSKGRKATAPDAPMHVSEEMVKKLTAVFKLLADKSRLKIVLALAEQGEMHVSALCDMLSQSQPAVSHHLTLMRTVGLVDYDRHGKHNYYHLASDFMRNLLERFFSESGNGHRAINFEDFSLTFKRR
jgi:ArsR family transcriptional regulator